MRHLLEKLEKLASNGKILLLVDGAGAFLSAFFLFAVLRAFGEYVGMPQSTLTLLSAIAFAFCVYDICVFFLVKKNWRPFLLAISVANLLYCGLTLALVVDSYEQLTILGLTYFLLEMLVMCVLVFVEMYVLKISWEENA